MSDLPIAIRPAEAADLAAVEALLVAASLPTSGVGQMGDALLVAEVDGALAGAAGLEVYSGAGLLRSVVTAPAWRGHGIAGLLVERLLAIAWERGLRRVYLLTETAGGFFPRFGFRAIPRADVEAAVRGSAEFSILCPASAVTMVREAPAVTG
jgi:amino-acid N-acetyltransferase